MGRFREAAQDDEREEGIDISPLIDCIFILLIFFIVTTTFVEETGVEVDKPQAASASMLEKTSILIAITREDQVFYGGRAIGLQGVRATVERQMRAEGGEQVPVIVQADRASNSGLLVQVVGEAKAAGATKVSIAAKSKG